MSSAKVKKIIISNHLYSHKHTDTQKKLKQQSIIEAERSKGGEERAETYLDSQCMWPGPSIGIIIKDLGVGETERGRGSRRCTSDVGLVPGPAPGRCTGRDIARRSSPCGA